MSGPIWGLRFSKRLDIMFKPYDNTKWGLYEDNTSIDLWFQLFHNYGNSMSNYHQYFGSIKLLDRNANLIDGFNTNSETFTYDTVTTYMPLPISGKELKLKLQYQWLNRRPSTINSILPKQGYGLNFNVEHSNSKIYGEFDNTRLITDMFINYSQKNIPIKIRILEPHYVIVRKILNYLDCIIMQTSLH